MEKPILFSTPMVQAILSGRKTMTRRVIKKQPPHHTFSRVKGDHGCETEVADGYFMNPPWEVGDTLWVRETWCFWPNHDNDSGYGHDLFRGEYGIYLYKAERGMEPYNEKWKPSIHMPRIAARLFLKIKNIRVERLQDITEEDAIFEGIPVEILNEFGRPLGWFKSLWDSINAKRGYEWAFNPWVWVIEFERVSVDELD